MVGKLRKLSATFIKITFLDFVVKLAKNRGQQRLLVIPDSTKPPTCNSHISQTRTDKKMILAVRERYNSLLFPIKISQSLVVQNLMRIMIKIDWSGKQNWENRYKQPKLTTQTIYSSILNLWSLSMGLVDMPTQIPAIITKNPTKT